MKRNNSKLFILGILASLAIKAEIFAESNKDQMWSSLQTASGTAVFTINLPTSGCVNITYEVAGKNQTERLWGPRFMEKGTYKLKFPEVKVLNKKGKIELFNVDLIPAKSTGTRGKGERQFDTPLGIDYDDTKKEILVADTGNDRIIRLGKDGRFIGRHGGFGLSFNRRGKGSDGGEDSLDHPYDVAAGGFSNFYVSDQNNDRTCIFDSYKSYRGNLYPRSNDRRNSLNKPKGIVTDYENNIWVVDGRSDRVIKISPSGSKILEIGGFGVSSKQLRNPTQVDVSIDGSIYIADRGKSRIAVFDRLGSYKYEIKDKLQAPTGVSIDSDGLIYVCDDSTNELILFTPKGKRLAVLETANDGSTFKKPSDLSVCDDMVFLLDSGNHRIVHIKREKEGFVVSWQGPSTVVE